jgi:hypothetical protein
MIRLLTMLATAMPFTMGSALALGYMSGDDLLANCRADVDSNGQGRCLGYIAGLADFIITRQELRKQADICFPDGASAEQMRDIVVRFLEARPQIRQYKADGAVVEALLKVWSCPKR